MKLKKILASLTAAALAVTTMAFAPVGAASTIIASDVAGATGTFSDSSNDNGGITVGFSGYEWANTINCDDYTAIKMTYDVTSLGNGKFMSLIINSGDSIDNGTGWTTASNWSLAEGTNQSLTIDLTQYPGKAFQWIGYQVGGPKNTASTCDFKIKTVELIEKSSTPSETVDVANNVAGATGTFSDSSNDNGGITVGFSGYEWANTINCDDYTAIKMTYDVTSLGNGKFMSLIINSGDSIDNGTGWTTASNWSLAEGTNQSLTIDLTQYPGKAFQWIGYQVGGPKNTESTCVFTIKSVVLVKKATAPATTEITPKVTTDATYKAASDESEADIKAAVLNTAKITNLGDVVLDSADYTLTASDITDGKVTVTFALTEAGEAKYTLAEDSVTSASCEIITLYAVTVSSNNEAMGTASADVSEAAEGTKVTLTATSKDGYKFDKWESEQVTVENNSFTMPAKDVTVTAVFAVKEPDEFDIKIAASENGSVSVKSGVTAAKKDDTIELTVEPKVGYELDKITVNGAAIDGTSFTMPGEDVTVTAVFKKADYKITVSETSNGKLKVDKTTAQLDDKVTVTATADNGYELSEITVNGKAIEGNTFTMPAENVTVSAVFKKLIGKADAEIKAPEGIDISFAGSKENVIAAVFGDDYAKLVESGVKLDVVMTVKDESAVAEFDKDILKYSLPSNQSIGLILDIDLVKTVDGVSEAIAETAKPVSFKISVPDSIIADGRIYSVVRIHNGKAQNIGGTFDSASKTISIASNLFSTYAIVYEEAPEPVKPAPTYYSVVSDNHSAVNISSAAAGTIVSVKTEFGYDAEIYCGGNRIAVISDRGEFTMPAGNVRIVSVDNGYLAMMSKALPNSYIFVYDSDMNYIKTNGSTRGIKGEGKITVKLGEEYAGKTITLYKGRKSTNVKVAAKTLNDDGYATFTVSAGMNYTAVVE